MSSKNICVIGASTGGPKVLRKIFKNFPKINASILLVQHMPKYINKNVKSKFNSLMDMEVKLAEDGDHLKHGVFYIAPSDVHMKIINNDTIKLFDDEKINYVRPSADVTMKSIKNRDNHNLMGIVLTGMGEDGSEGIKHLKEKEAITIVQNEKTSSMFNMPEAAIKTGKVDHELGPEGIKDKIIKWSKEN